MKKPGIMNVKKTIFTILVLIGIFISCEKKDNYLFCTLSHKMAEIGIITAELLTDIQEGYSVEHIRKIKCSNSDIISRYDYVYKEKY